VYFSNPNGPQSLSPPSLIAAQRSSKRKRAPKSSKSPVKKRIRCKPEETNLNDEDNRENDSEDDISDDSSVAESTITLSSRLSYRIQAVYDALKSIERPDRLGWLHDTQDYYSLFANFAKEVNSHSNVTHVIPDLPTDKPKPIIIDLTAGSNYKLINHKITYLNNIFQMKFLMKSTMMMKSLNIC
jgi:hypothetical protein